MIRLWDLEWQWNGSELACGPSRLVVGQGLGWAAPRGAVMSLRSVRGLQQLEALVRAHHQDDGALCLWLHSLGLMATYGLAGVSIGVPDAMDATLPPIVRASGKTLADAVVDLAPRLGW